MLLARLGSLIRDCLMVQLLHLLTQVRAVGDGSGAAAFLVGGGPDLVPVSGVDAELVGAQHGIRGVRRVPCLVRPTKRQLADVWVGDADPGG